MGHYCDSCSVSRCVFLENLQPKNNETKQRFWSPLRPNSDPLRYLVRSWSQAGSKPNSITLSGSKLVRSCDQLRASFEPDTVTEFGFHKLSFSTEMCLSSMSLCDIGTSRLQMSTVLYASSLFQGYLHKMCCTDASHYSMSVETFSRQSCSCFRLTEAPVSKMT